MTILNNTIPTLISSSNTVNQVNIIQRKTAHNSATGTVNNESDVTGKGLVKDANQAEEAQKYGRTHTDNFTRRIKDAERADNKYASVYNKKGNRIDEDRENKFIYEGVEDPYKAIARKAYELTESQERALNTIAVDEEDLTYGAESVAEQMISFIYLLAENRMLETFSIAVAYQKGFDIITKKYKDHVPSLMLKTYIKTMQRIVKLGAEDLEEEDSEK